MKQTILAFSFVLTAVTANAAPFQVTLDTSQLAGVHTLGFGLTNFDPAFNIVSLSEFDFDGGSAVAASEDCTLGGFFSGDGCSGNLSAGVTLTDVDPIAAFFTQQFNAGSSLSFVLNTTNEFSGASIADRFGMFLCDGSLTTCYSDDANIGAMLLLDLSGGTLSSSSFVTFAATLQSLDAPIVTEITANTVPEPGTMVLLGSGVIAVVCRRASWRSARRSRP